MKLIIATPSPFARKVRIVLREKAIQFEEQVDGPWNPNSIVSKINPLGKVPVLVLDDGEMIYDSSVIIEYLETLRYEPALIPLDANQRIKVRQIEVLADGIADAAVLITLEKHRIEKIQSLDWINRQQTKIDAGIAALSKQLGRSLLFCDDALSIADIATACTLGYLDLRFPDYDWRSNARNLANLTTSMEKRGSFKVTKPVVQDIAIVE
ncbi:MAG: glutathione S-transferase [Magnetovibrio sp.]|nr:glutathione S-transferase [Magnetovibrio sp.]